MSTETLKIAVQKSGRLFEESLKILKDCGISIDNGRDQLKVKARNFPLEIMYLRNGDIPQYLKDGVVDIGIIGENLIYEKAEDLEVLEKLGFSRCRVSLAVAKGTAFSGLKDLEGKKIATSYPNTVKKMLDQAGVSADLHMISGSVEIAPNIGLADAIVDIVSSGNTLFKNNLQEVYTLLNSEAVLTASPLMGEPQKEILQRLRFRLQSVLKARDSRYVLLNAPNEKVEEIIKVLPGMRSPTVLPLAEKGWSSLHTVIQKEKFWEIIDELKAKGAEGILVCPIEKMVY